MCLCIPVICYKLYVTRYMIEDPRKLRDLIADQCEAKELSHADLAKKSDTPLQYVESLLAGETRRLPAFPYIRTHLVRIAQVLGLPPELLTAKYKAEFTAMHSGPADRLPGNRFALPSYQRAYLVAAGVFALLVVGYLVSRTGFFGRPNLTIDMPPTDPNPYIVTSSSITLAGRTDPGDNLFINGQHVAVGTDGTFSKEYQLLPEINIIEFAAKRFLGRQVTATRQVYFDTASTSSTTSTVSRPTPKPTTSTSSPSSNSSSSPLSPQ